MHQRTRYLLTVVCLLAYASPGVAQNLVAETYRSPHAPAVPCGVNPDDGSCWMVAGVSVLHRAADGTLLQQLNQFSYPLAVALNTSDGSCWVADGRFWVTGTADPGAIVHLAPDGTELWRGGGPWPVWSLCVNSADGSVWIATSGGPEGDHEVIHLAADGQELGRLEGLTWPGAVVPSPIDGTLWVVDFRENCSIGHAAHLAADGTVLWGMSGGFAVLVNPTDGSCWVMTQSGLTHVSAGHTVLASITRDQISGAAVDSADGSLWYSTSADEPAVVHVAADGAELLRLSGPAWRVFPSAVNPADHSVWAAMDEGVVHFSAAGEVLWEDRGPARASAVAVDPKDGSFWLAGWGRGYVDPWICHYAASDVPQWTQGVEMWGPQQLTLDPADGSCWFADLVQLRHLAPDGTPLPGITGGPVSSMEFVVRDPADGSLWTDEGAGLSHYAPDGTLLGSVPCPGRVTGLHFSASNRALWAMVRFSDVSLEVNVLRIAPDGTTMALEGVTGATSISADPRDGSVWVGELRHGSAWVSRISHYDAGGALLWESASGPGGDWGEVLLAVEPRQGACWVVKEGDVVLLSAGGDELGRTGLWNYRPSAITVNPADSSCWLVGDRDGLRKVSLAPFADVPANTWAADAIRACRDAGLVQGYGDGYHPEAVVTRDQMAGYLSRVLTGGGVPAGPEQPTFRDVPLGHWAYDFIEYCQDQHIVGGYPDGRYRPAFGVDRGQMAAFLARGMAVTDGGHDLSGYVPPAAASFVDVPNAGRTAWAYASVEYLKEHAVVSGYPDGLYHPEIPVTREQMAVFVVRAFDLLP